jgi:DHA1 family bicyclomycin/chloramphenicol resistance-like MFS transporter
MLTGALAMAVVGLFTDGRPLPMVAGMAGGALIALVLTWLTLGGVRSEPTEKTGRAQQA